MEENVVVKLFDSLADEVKNRVVDVVVLPDFTKNDDAMKLQVVIDSFAAFDVTLPTLFEGHAVELAVDAAPAPEDSAATASSDGGRRHHILRPGIACGGRGTSNGTLGAIVFDLRNNGAPCILSNWHVLRGARRFRGRTTDIYQPGKLIGGTPRSNIIATYQRRALGDIDAAIATLNTTRSFDTKVLLTDATLTRPRLPRPGDVLEKSGSRTGVTRGQVARIHGNRVWLVPVGGAQSGAPNLSKSGDSGSVWYYPETGEVAVLHTYGDPDTDHNQEWASGYLMTAVADALDVSIVPI